MLVMIVTNNEWMKKSSSHFLIIDFDEPKAPLSDDNDKLQVSQACHFHDWLQRPQLANYSVLGSARHC